jgi:uncharacterized protein YndB with AHSA1/START domain
MSATNTDRIADKVLLRTPRARVWHALANPYEMHVQGWAGQMKSIAEYLVMAA